MAVTNTTLTEAVATDEVLQNPTNDNAPLPPASIRSKLIRVGAALGLLALVWTVAEVTGLRALITVDQLRTWIDQAGPLGALGFVAAFSLGILVQLPGVIFIAAARFAYGPIIGFVVAYLGALAAVSLSFVVVRSTGGKALEGIRFKPLARMLKQLDRHPLRTIAALRAVLWVAPPLNYALALSSVRFRDYFIGSAVGLAAPIAALVFLADRAFACLGVMG